MSRDEAIAILTAHRSELDRFRVKSLSLFGSVARDEAMPGSDIDVLVEFDGPATFDGFLELKVFLETSLGQPVDLITRRSVKPRFASIIENDLVRVA